MKRRGIFSVFILLTLIAVVIVVRWRRPHHLGPGVEQFRGSGDGHSFTVVRVDLRRASVRLFWKNRAGDPLLTFNRLAIHLAPDRLIFATNAGIFSAGYAPLGLHVENGHEFHRLTLSTGSGNFFLQPNGVFFIDASGAHIVDSPHYPGTTPQTRLATQSGPLLLAHGQFNPNFRPDSTNTQIRSAVGVLSPDHVVFVLSNEPVTFHQLATFFRDKLSCPDALYLDGAISRFYPDEKPSGGIESNFAGILAITENGRRLQARHPPEPQSQPANGEGRTQGNTTFSR